MSETKEQVKHTPGPWESMVSSHDRNQKPLSYGIHAIGKSSRWIAQIEFESGVDNEDDANARLIAAAPELLEACKLFIGVLLNKQASASAKKAQYEFLKHLPETWAYIQKAKVAIAKAEGR